MDQRLALHDILTNLLESNNVYFQPPESKKLDYPCIVYKFNRYTHTFANNNLYLNKKQYSLTVIDRDPDTIIPDKLLQNLKLVSFDRHYIANNLNHYAFRLYF